MKVPLLRNLKPKAYTRDSSTQQNWLSGLSNRSIQARMLRVLGPRMASTVRTGRDDSGCKRTGFRQGEKQNRESDERRQRKCHGAGAGTDWGVVTDVLGIRMVKGSIYRQNVVLRATNNKRDSYSVLSRDAPASLGQDGLAGRPVMWQTVARRLSQRFDRNASHRPVSSSPSSPRDTRSWGLANSILASYRTEYIMTHDLSY